MPLRVARPVVALAFAATAFWCTLLVLRAATVQSNGLDAELASIRAEVKGQPTLFLVADAYGLWKLRGASATPFTPYAVVPRVPVKFVARETPASQAPADGFAAVAGSGLDRFRYAVTTNAAYNAAPPPNWSLVKATPHYFLWRRSGTSAAPCGTGTRPVSVVGPSTAWQIVSDKPSAAQPPSSGVVTGTTVQQTLTLPSGRWELDLQYQTPTPLTVASNGQQFTLPEDLDVFGPFWKAGTIQSSGGPTKILVTEHRRPFPSEQRTGRIGAVVAVRIAPASCKAN